MKFQFSFRRWEQQIDHFIVFLLNFCNVLCIVSVYRIYSTLGYNHLLLPLVLFVGFLFKERVQDVISSTWF